MEQQGHGRAADVDRPLTYEQMADDRADWLPAMIAPFLDAPMPESS